MRTLCFKNITTLITRIPDIELYKDWFKMLCGYINPYLIQLPISVCGSNKSPTLLKLSCILYIINSGNITRIRFTSII